MEVHLIWAEASGGVIGAAGTLPWHLPEDLAGFRERTQGEAVLMGRATWESLPVRSRPLPERRNLVLTRRVGWVADGVEAMHSVEQVLALDDVEDLWIIGGGALFTTFARYASHAVRTVINHTFAGDTHAPRLSAEWTRSRRVPTAGWHTSSTGLRFATEDYRRTR